MSAIFDNYGLQARLRPALLALFPIFIIVAIWFPDIYKTTSGLLGLAVSCGLTVILGQFARNQGLRAQDKLVKNWGGLPTTTCLRHLDINIDNVTKARYHTFLEAKVPNWKAPTRTEELEDKQSSDARYLSAVRWLREYTRNTQKYPLVFGENISYGFRRNAYGIKYFGVFLSFIAVVFLSEKMRHFSLEQLISDKIAYSLTMLVIAALLFWWVFGVTKESVFKAAKGYSRALLAVCDESD